MEIYNFGKIICRSSSYKLKSHLKKDQLIEAKDLYQVILQAFPKKYTRITTSNKTIQNNFTQSPPQNAVMYNNMGNVLQDQGAGQGY